ncbi:MAG: hypothetical protein ABII01_06150 [Candidatus Woesearchaeota archaeon]
MARRIETFNGDFDELRDLILRSWHPAYDGQAAVFDYSVPYLQWNLQGSTSDKELSLSYYDGSTLVGFVGGMPRTFSLFSSQTVNGSLCSFLSSDVSTKRSRIAYDLVTHSSERHHQRGYDFPFFFLDKNFSGSHLLFHKHADEHIYDLVSLPDTSFLIKVFDAQRFSDLDASVSNIERRILKMWESDPVPFEVDGKMREYDDSDLSTCLSLLNSYKFHINLARHWTEDELQWQLSHQGISSTTVFEKDNQIQGLINYHVVPMHGRPGVAGSLAIIDNIYWFNLSDRERQSFLSQTLNQIQQSQDILGVLVLDFPYYNHQDNSSVKIGKKSFILRSLTNLVHNKPFRKTGFLPLLRRLEPNFIVYDPAIASQIGKCNSVYSDFR